MFSERTHVRTFVLTVSYNDLLNCIPYVAKNYEKNFSATPAASVTHAGLLSPSNFFSDLSN